VEEMHAISDFIGGSFPEAVMFEGAAGLYQRIADDRAMPERIDAFFSA
jgi:hypothetical protein